MTQFQSGDLLIQQYPHALFERLAKGGYKLRYRMDPVPFRELIVEVLQGEKVVAHANFSDDGSAAHCQNVYVEENHRRLGIANTIYIFAEVAYGKWLWDFWKEFADDRQIATGRALWAQLNRPFGHQGMIAGRPVT